MPLDADDGDHDDDDDDDAGAGQARAAVGAVDQLLASRSAQDAGLADPRPAALRPVGVHPRTTLDGHRRQPRPPQQATTRPAGGSLGAAQHRGRIPPQTARHHRRKSDGVYV